MNILLLEPNYKNKYPPLGLMKIATFHKELGDNVVFSKGANDTLKSIDWERIYINSLFTFEWPATKKMIDFAKELTSDQSIIYLGGIAATLLPIDISREYPDINIVNGLLNTPGKLHLPNDEYIDTLPPDYSILGQITYKYPADNAYFSYATRGCGMNCSFCAVQRLEPDFIAYVCIKTQIQNVINQCGTKRNLMLMDNNVLKSPHLADIVQDIVDLGFEAGCKYKNPKTNKLVKRHVDFNQGLDATFLTPEKAALLSRLALTPVRIAFDHIKQQDKYVKAIRTCFEAGLRSFSNYLLYNTDYASWKGSSYGADTPEELYERLKFNVDLCEELNANLHKNGINEKVFIYSFPMRYIPLADMKRGYIGNNWDKKALRAIQVFITPTQGKGVSSATFFNASFGSTLDDFKLALYAPENILVRRGSLRLSKKDLADQEKCLAKKNKYKFNRDLSGEWKSLLDIALKNNVWNNFINNYVKDNIFNFDIYMKITNSIEKQLFLYYFTPTCYKNNFYKLPKDEQLFINNFLNTKAKHLKQYLTNI